MVARPARVAAFLPELFPIPDAVGDGVRKFEPKLMSKHTDLAAVVRFVREHVAEHFRPNRPSGSPAVAVKFLDEAAPSITGLTNGIVPTERFSKHIHTASGALRQCFTGLLRRAARAVELRRDFQVWSGEANPLGAHIVHVREDGRDAADLAGRCGPPCAGVKIFDEQLVHALVRGKYLDCRLGEWSLTTLWARGRASDKAGCGVHILGVPYKQVN